MIINGYEILGANVPIPGDITWQSIFKRLKTVVKSRTIGVRKALNAAMPYTLATIAGGSSVVGTALIVLSQEDAHQPGQADIVADKFANMIEQLKIKGQLTDDDEKKIKNELNNTLPTDDEISKAEDEQIKNCPTSNVQKTEEELWYKQPAVWIVSAITAAVIGALVYFILKRKKR